VYEEGSKRDEEWRCGVLMRSMSCATRGSLSKECDDLGMATSGTNCSVAASSTPGVVM
jgi:hypothetical protein